MTRQILDYMKSVAPNEGCGYVKDGVFYPLANGHPDPVNYSYPLDMPAPGEFDVYVHSHPGGPFYPSETDMRSQIATDATWSVAAWDDTDAHVFSWPALDEPLIGRGFRHGVTDCYEAVRSFYLQVHSIELRPYARAWRWHVGKGDLYADHFAREGFSEIPGRDILPGDAVLVMVNSRVFNHAAVYIGNGLIYHHLATSRNGYDPSRLSTVESLAMFGLAPMKVLRHENHSIDRTPGQTIWPQA